MLKCSYSASSRSEDKFSVDFKTEACERVGCSGGELKRGTKTKACWIYVDMRKRNEGLLFLSKGERFYISKFQSPHFLERLVRATCFRNIIVIVLSTLFKHLQNVR